MRRSRLIKYFVLLFLSIFLIQLFALNTFADDVDAVTRAAEQVPIRETGSTAARSDAILGAQRQVSLNLPSSPVIDMFETGAGIFFGIISNVWVILLLVLVLLTILFYAIYSLGLMNIPLFKGDSDPEKKRHMRMIAMTLAILSSVGLLGYAGYDGRTFDINNVVVRSFDVLDTFGMVGVWFMSILLGGIVYFSGKKGKDGLEPGPGERRAGWGLTLVASGASLWFGSTMLGSLWSVLGATLFFIGLISLLIPRRTDTGGRPVDKQGNYVNPQPGYPPSPKDRRAEDRSINLEKFKKRIPKFNNVDDLNRRLKSAMQNNLLNLRWVDDAGKLLADIKSHADSIMGKDSFKNMVDDIKGIDRLTSDGEKFTGHIRRNSRREDRLLNIFEKRLNSQKADLTNLKNAAESNGFTEIISEIQAEENVILAVEDQIKRIDMGILQSLSHLKSSIIPDILKLKVRNKALKKLLRKGGRKEKKAKTISEDIINFSSNILGRLDEVKKYLNFVMSCEYAVNSFLGDIAKVDSGLQELSEKVVKEASQPKNNNMDNTSSTSEQSQNNSENTKAENSKTDEEKKVKNEPEPKVRRNPPVKE